MKTKSEILAEKAAAFRGVSPAVRRAQLAQNAPAFAARREEANAVASANDAAAASRAAERPVPAWKPGDADRLARAANRMLFGE